MRRLERDLVSAVRHELAAVTPDRACCRASELDALADPGRRADVAIARTVHRLIAAAHPVDGTPSARAIARVRRLAADRAASHCRLAYLRGRILSRGSLSLASGLIHLEIVVTEAEGRELAALAAAERLGGALRLRRGRGVVVWKDTSQICDMLRRLGAGGSIAEIEARGVARQIRGALNRTVNAETANLRRAVRAGMRQARAVAVVMEEHGLPAESLLQRVGVARLANPDATIAELGLALGLSRGAVQRALGSIEKLAATVRQEAALR